MVVAMTTATVMVMPQACGQSPSTQPSMTDAPPCTMRAAPPPWHPHSAMGAREIQRLGLWVYNKNNYYHVYFCFYQYLSFTDMFLFHGLNICVWVWQTVFPLSFRRLSETWDQVMWSCCRAGLEKLSFKWRNWSPLITLPDLILLSYSEQHCRHVSYVIKEHREVFLWTCGTPLRDATVITVFHREFVAFCFSNKRRKGRHWSESSDWPLCGTSISLLWEANLPGGLVGISWQKKKVSHQIETDKETMWQLKHDIFSEDKSKTLMVRVRK